MHTRIRSLRVALGLTQEEFGSRIGVGRSSIAKLESGENNPSKQTLELICTKFGANPEWLKAGADAPMFLPASDDAAAMVDRIMAGEDEFRKSVFRAFARLGDAEWQLLREIVDRIRESGR